MIRPGEAGAPLLLVVGLMLLGCQGKDPEVEGLRVERRDLTVQVKVTGELEARSNTSLGPPSIERLWDFKISRLAPEGQVVEAGELVIAFDTSELEQRLARAQADRDSAEATLEKTETDLEIEMRRTRLQLAEAKGRERKARLKVEVPKGTVARNELEQHRIDLELAISEIQYAEGAIRQLERRSQAELQARRVLAERARREVTLLEQSIERMSVKAPRTGTLIYKSNWRGEKKKVGDRTWRNETVVQIPDLNTLMATAEVDEAEAARLRVGQPVEFQLDAHPGRSYTARVSRIGRSVQQRSWRDPRRVIEIDLELDELDTERMRPGNRLVGQLEVGRAEDTLVVPASAVRFDDQGAWVELLDPDSTRRTVRPRLGLHDGEFVEVIEGLEEGDRLATQPRAVVAGS